MAYFALLARGCSIRLLLRTAAGEVLGLIGLIAVILTIVGGFGVGWFSTLANGCPFRQHVLAAQGATTSIAYLAGFLLGAVIFHSWMTPLLLRFLS